MAGASFGSWYMIDEIDLAALLANHAGLARLCAELEAVADRLPSRPTKAEVARLSEELLLRLPASDRRDRTTLNHIFLGTHDSEPGKAALAEIGRQRSVCIGQAQDIASVLDPNDLSKLTVETLGYMLRCFFQSSRQAIVFEELAVLHLAAARLTAEARALLVESVARHCAE
ncbi:hypothetical protein WSK_0718 [Novosphingobium sp. Rr 2-17]|nr:hypothetical protein WSK_0718 [Novosphingobium sp. Rr 2-17]